MCPRNASFLDIAQFYENEFGRVLLTEHLQNQLDTSNIKPTAVHEGLVTLLPVGRIYTTNFDCLTEDAARSSRIRWRAIVNKEELAFLDRDRLNIIKLHGDLVQPKTLVITAQDYESYFRKNPTLTNLIVNEFQTGTVLFVGYGHGDLDLRMILRRVTDENGNFNRTHYTVQLNPEIAVVTDLKRRGMHVISIQCESNPMARNEALSHWLDEFQKAVMSYVGPSGIAAGRNKRPNHNFPARAHNILRGRENELKKIYRALEMPGVSMISIEGDTGVGKTALAYEAGLACLSPHSSAPKFDYAVWVSVDKPDQEFWLDEVINAVALVSTGDRIPDARPASRFDEYELVHEKRVIIIINNYESVHDDQLTRWIANLPNTSKVLVTTRSELPRETKRYQRISLGGLKTDDALLLARDHASLLGNIDLLKDSEIEELAVVTGGNPQVIKLALCLVYRGTISLSEVLEQLRGIPAGRAHERLLPVLFDWSWTLLSDDARKLLMIAPLFIGTSAIRQEALYAVSEMPQGDFERALDQVLVFRLMERTQDRRLITHSMTRSLARNKLQERRELRELLNKAYVKYFYAFAQQNVTRETSFVPYWSTLVSDQMRYLDPEWSCIEAQWIGHQRTKSSIL